MKVGDFVYQTRAKFYGVILRTFPDDDVRFYDSIRLRVIKDTTGSYRVGYEGVWINNVREITKEEKAQLI
jgi:hypothetical protein